MKDDQPGTLLKDRSLTPQMTDQTRAMPTDEPLATVATGGDEVRSPSMLQVSPKWQLVLIGGAFIFINVIVMVLFVVALILRH